MATIGTTEDVIRIEGTSRAEAWQRVEEQGEEMQSPKRNVVH
jgi:hypothetical protein